VKTKKRFVALCAGAVLSVLLMPRPAAADAWTKRTEVRFSHPVELPGKVMLPSGEYVMKLMDSQSQRHIVQVFNKEQNHIFATIFAIPTQREQPAERTILTFYETPGNQPMYIRHWYYPGDTIGQEFVYSKEQAKYIASLSKTPVPARNGNKWFIERPTSEAVAMNQQEPAREAEVAQATPPVREDRQFEAFDDVDAVPAEPIPAEPSPDQEPAVDADQEPAPAPADQAPPSEPAVSAPRDTLPATAGYGGAVGLLGVALLAVSGLMRDASKY
jgi:hypothetical protein